MLRKTKIYRLHLPCVLYNIDSTFFQTWKKKFLSPVLNIVKRNSSMPWTVVLSKYFLNTLQLECFDGVTLIKSYISKRFHIAMTPNCKNCLLQIEQNSIIGISYTEFESQKKYCWNKLPYCCPYGTPKLYLITQWLKCQSVTR